MLICAFLGLWLHFSLQHVLATGARIAEASDIEVDALGIGLLQTSMAFQERLEVKASKQKPIGSRWTPSSPTAIVGACGHNYDFSTLEPEDPSWSAEDFIAAWEEERSKLSVPFYMYDGMVGTTNFTASQVALQKCLQNNTVMNMAHSGGELFIYQQLQNHPWRVSSSKDAKIIVVPIAMTMLGSYFANESLWANYKGVNNCSGYHVVDMFNAVAQSSLFQERPNDHLWIDIDDYATGNSFSRAHFFNPLNSMFAKQVTDGRWLESCRHPSTLVAPFCPQERGSPDNEARSLSIFFAGQVYAERNYDEPGGYDVRKQLFKHHETMPEQTLLITNDSPPDWSWPRCPDNMSAIPADRISSPCTGKSSNTMLEQSQFAICPAGDNPTSPRLYDAVNFGAIPILISDEAFSTSAPFQCFVPYNQISLKIAEEDCYEDCGVALSNATSRFDVAALRRTRQLIRHFRKDLLWNAEGSRVMENLLLTALQMRNPDGTNLPECCGTQCHPL
jgi:hypothetical protein